MTLRQAHLILIILICILTVKSLDAASLEAYKSKALTPVKYSINPVLKPMLLSSNGTAKAVIVIPEQSNHSGYYKKIANIMKKYLDQATGADFKIVKKLPPNTKGIFIGPCAYPAVAKLYKKQKSLGNESFTIKSIKDGLVIVGKDNVSPVKEGGWKGLQLQNKYAERGTLWGTSDFLERLIGVRFYMPGKLGTIIPDLKRKTVSLPAISYTDKPVYSMRLSGYGAKNKPGYYRDSALLNHDRKESYLWDDLLRQSDYKHQMFQHSDSSWYKAYAKTNPEYFALRKDGSRELGKRAGHSTHRCLSNEVGFQQHLQNIDDFYKGKLSKNEIEERFSNAPPMGKYINWAPHDGFKGCQCKNCLKLMDGNIYSRSQCSRLIWGYAKKLAKAIKQRWPNKILRVPAYGNCRILPKGFVISDNMFIMMCKPLGGAIGLLKEPKAWNRSIKDLDRFINQKEKPWLYSYYPQSPRKSGNFPYLAPNVLKKFLTYAQDKISGTYRCGHYTFSFALDSTIYYMYAKMLWNPDLDIDACLREYCDLMFGPAADEMYRYFIIQTDCWENTLWPKFKPVLHGWDKQWVWTLTYPRKVREQLKTLLLAAKAKAPGNTLYSQRMDWMVEGTKAFFSEGDFADFTKISQTDCPPLAPTINGDLADWQGVTGLVLTNNQDGTTTGDKTVFYTAHDDKNIYIAGRVAQKTPFHAGSKKIARDSNVWLSDSIEIFICSEQAGLAEALMQQTDQFHQIIIDYRGVVFDGYKSAMTGEFDKLINFDFQYNMKKTDSGYDFEIAIPYKSLNTIVPKNGTIWNVNFYRNKHIVAGKFEHQAWSPTGGGFDQTSKFGLLRFSDSKMIWKIDSAKVKWKIAVKEDRRPAKKIDGKMVKLTQKIKDGKLFLRIRATKMLTGLTEVIFNMVPSCRPNVKVSGKPSFKFAYNYNGEGLKRVRCAFLDTKHGRPSKSLRYLEIPKGSGPVMTISDKRGDKNKNNIKGIDAFMFALKIKPKADFTFVLDAAELYEENP